MPRQAYEKPTLTLVMCRSVSCDHEARFVVYWPGQTTLMCTECAARALRIAEVMMMGLDIQPLSIHNVLSALGQKVGSC